MCNSNILEIKDDIISPRGVSATWTLAALPLFIWMSEILFRTKLSEDLFHGLAPWLNKVPSRLLHVNILGCTIFAAVSGSSAATAATIGKMTIPELTKRGYLMKVMIGTLAGSGTPPVGFNLFVMQGLTKINILKIAGYALPFFFLLLTTIVLLTVFPQIATWLPELMTKK